MTKRWVFVLALIFALVPAPKAFTQPDTDGNTLLHNCSLVVKFYDGGDMPSTLDNMNAGICMGMIRGTADMMNTWTMLDHGPVDNSAIHGCLPQEPVKTIQLVRVVVKYLNDHPEQLNNSDTRLVNIALAAAYPCKKVVHQ